MKYLILSVFILFTSININADDVNKISSAYATQTSDLQVSSSGIVVKLLSDENKGSRHQRFILKLSNNQTVLVAHNIDLAPKITSLHKGDIVSLMANTNGIAKAVSYTGPIMILQVGIKMVGSSTRVLFTNRPLLRIFPKMLKMVK